MAPLSPAAWRLGRMALTPPRIELIDGLLQQAQRLKGGQAFFEASSQALDVQTDFGRPTLGRVRRDLADGRYAFCYAFLRAVWAVYRSAESEQKKASSEASTSPAQQHEVQLLQLLRQAFPINANVYAEIGNSPAAAWRFTAPALVNDTGLRQIIAQLNPQARRVALGFFQSRGGATRPAAVWEALRLAQLLK